MKTAEIRYKTKPGGSGAGRIPTTDISDFLKNKFKQRLEARVEIDGWIVGEVLKDPDGRWTWYVEREYYD